MFLASIVVGALASMLHVPFLITLTLILTWEMIR